jgi:transcriptional regulator with XRE-family HTH domain
MLASKEVKNVCLSILLLAVCMGDTKFSVLLSKIHKTYRFKVMMFNEKIKQLREDHQIPQRKVAEALDIDSATYCKIERGERRARKEHIPIIAEILQANKDELLTLWLADQIAAVVADEKEIADKALKIAQQTVNKK